MEKIESYKELVQIIKLIEAEPESERAQHFAELGRRSLFYLVYDVLGYTDINLQLAWDMCKFWEQEDRCKLALLPRGTFKTTILTMGGIIKDVTNNPNIRILLTNATLKNAQAILKGIKDHFIYNEKFRTLYPELCPADDSKTALSKFGGQDELRVPCQKPGIREATVEIGAVDGNLVSRHYEVHYGDDLVNHLNVSTKDQIDKVDNFIKAAFSLLEPTVGRCNLIGTRWFYDDPYGRIIDDPKTEYKIYIRKILEPDAEGRMVSIFPERFPKHEIASIKRKQGPYLFSGQYMNEPLASEDQVFKLSWFKRYSELPDHMIKQMDRVAFVDPAISDSRKADYTAFIVLGACAGGIYVLDAFRRRMNPGEIIESIFEVHARWKVREFGVETIAFQKALAFFINRTMLARGVHVPIKEVGKDGNITKEMRIRGLQPVIQYCNFYVKEGMDDLIDEAVRFPRCTHDDLVDALSNAQMLLKPIYRHHLVGEMGKAGLTFNDAFNGNSSQSALARRIGGHRFVRGNATTYRH